MTREQFREIAVGDVVRHKNGTDGYIVHCCHGTTITIVRIMEMTNPAEWDLIYKSNRTRVEA